MQDILKLRTEKIAKEFGIENEEMWNALKTKKNHWCTNNQTASDEHYESLKKKLNQKQVSDIQQQHPQGKRL